MGKALGSWSGMRKYLATKISRSVNLDKAFFNAS